MVAPFPLFSILISSSFFKPNKSLLYLRISFSLYFLPFTCLYWFLSLVFFNILFLTSDSEKSFICLFIFSCLSIISLLFLTSFRFTFFYFFLSLVCSKILFPTSDSEKSFICLFTVSKPSIITLSSLPSFVAKASSTSIQRKFSFNAVCCICRKLSLISLASLYKCSNFSTSSSVNGSSSKFLIDVLYVKSPILTKNSSVSWIGTNDKGNWLTSFNA